MGSPIYEDWIKEERQEATEKATKKAIQDSVIYLLESSFELVPSYLKEKINLVEDVSILRGLLKKASTASDIEEFTEFLNRVTK